MLNPETSLRGAKAKAFGQLFEQILSITCHKARIKFEQLPSGCRWVGKRAVPVKTPFDFIACKNGKAIFFDAKTLDAKTFSKSSSTPHQIESLLAFELSGLTAGYIVWLREIDEIVFYKASQLKSLSRGDSLKSSDGVFLGKKDTLSLETLFNG
jgi:hypothetical protein